MRLVEEMLADARERQPDAVVEELYQACRRLVFRLLSHDHDAFDDIAIAQGIQAMERAEGRRDGSNATGQAQDALGVMEQTVRPHL